jgi:hypothetical protein
MRRVARIANKYLAQDNKTVGRDCAYSQARRRGAIAGIVRLVAG